MTFRGRAVVAVSLLTFVAACGGAAKQTSQPPVDETTADTAPPSPPATDSVSAGGAAAVPELLQFTAPLVGGGEFDGAAYAGRTTAFWFWAPT